jgi:hypothetical protein
MKIGRGNVMVVAVRWFCIEDVMVKTAAMSVVSG